MFPTENIRIAAQRHVKWVRSAENEKEVSRLWLHGKLILEQSERFEVWSQPVVAAYIETMKRLGICPVLESEHELEDFAYFYYRFQQMPEWEKQIAYQLVV